MSGPTEREWLEGLRYEDKFPALVPCESCHTPVDPDEAIYDTDTNPYCDVCAKDLPARVMLERVTRSDPHEYQSRIHDCDFEGCVAADAFGSPQGSTDG
jgi:hypothetical protein